MKLKRKLPCLFSIFAAAAWAGESERVPWETSRVTGSPDPPRPYAAEVVWPEIRFKNGLDIAYLEGEEKIFVVEQKGNIWMLPADLGASPGAPELFADLKPIVADLANVYGMTFHPAHAKNREVFLFYTISLGKDQQESRVARFVTRGEGEQLRLDPASEEVLLTFGGGGHNGGHLQFGPDGMLYFSVGDLEAPSPPDPKETGQDLSDLASSIVRIDIDRRDPGLRYRVPGDNPFLEVRGARPEVWAYGLRNPWKICFHPRTNDLWVGDVGWELWELLYRVERGGNYGWSIVEGPQLIKPDQSPGPSPISPPVVAYPHTEGASITGGYVYEGAPLPGLDGAYLYGDFVTGKIWGLWHDGTGLQRNEEIADTRQQIVTFGKVKGGEIVFLNWPDEQSLFRLVPNPDSGIASSFPKRLSGTGIFADVKSMEPSPGVYEFLIRAPMWQDGAASRYWVAVPGRGGFETEILRRRESPLLRYAKPVDTVLVKTLSLGGRRVETQLLHFDGYWKGYSYRWNEKETDAELVSAEGEDAEVGGVPWRFPSRTECSRCHSGNFTRPLAFYPGQIDRDGQLDRFRALGLIDGKFIEAAGFQKLADPRDEAAPLALRARSWLHANCSHCHRVSGGGSVPIQMNIACSDEELSMFGTLPTKGGFGLDDAKIIAPGDPCNSVLYYRAATAGIGHMPMIGARTKDLPGLRLLHDWIESLDEAAARSALPEAPGTTSEALALWGEIEAGGLSEAKRKQVLEAAAKSENLAIQGLFQGLE